MYQLMYKNIMIIHICQITSNLNNTKSNSHKHFYKQIQMTIQGRQLAYILFDWGG